MTKIAQELLKQAPLYSSQLEGDWTREEIAAMLFIIHWIKYTRTDRKKILDDLGMDEDYLTTMRSNPVYVTDLNTLSDQVIRAELPTIAYANVVDAIQLATGEPGKQQATIAARKLLFEQYKKRQIRQDAFGGKLW